MKRTSNAKQKWAASRQNQQNDCAPSEDSDQSGHPHSLIRVFAVHTKKAWVFSYLLSTQRRLWLDWANAGRTVTWFCHAAAHILMDFLNDSATGI